MAHLKRAWAQLIAMLRRRDLDREIEEELQSHLDLAAEDFERRGMSPEEARRMARVKLGAIEASKDAHRDARGLGWLEGLVYDLRFAVRGLRRDQAFTITAIVMLALAIGLNTTAFAVMDTMLYGGFPLVERNDRLLYIQERRPVDCCISYANFADWKQQATSFEEMAIVAGQSVTFSQSPDGYPLNSHAEAVSANMFHLLGVTPALGRDFTSADEAFGALSVVILSDNFWKQSFGQRPDIIGRVIYLDQQPATVIGVMPGRFDFPETTTMWVPLEQTPALAARVPNAYFAIGRLKDGVSPQQARAEIEAIGQQLATAYPENRDVVPRVETHAGFFMGPDAPMIYGSVWAAASLVLLIACANLANLTLVRTLGRSRELSTRIALGAGRARMLRQILLEAALLSAAGGVLGWSLAHWSVALWANATASQYQILDYTLGAGTSLYAIAISAAAMLLFGVAPMGRILHLDVHATLKGDARGSTQGRKGKRVAATLVAVQMALAMVLLAGAGILARSFVNVVGAETGVTGADQVLVGRVAMPAAKLPTAESRLAFWDRLDSALRALPGVVSVSTSSTVPVDNPGSLEFELDTPAAGGARPQVAQVTAGDAYFPTVGATVIAGREFLKTDLPESPAVALVNRSFAETYSPGADPIGRRIRFFSNGQPGAWRTVVGLVSNVMQNDPTREQFVPIAYAPMRQRPPASANLFVRTSGPATTLAAAVRQAIIQADPDLVLENFSTLDATFRFRADRMDIEHVEMAKHAAVAPIFAGIALLLATIGLYAVVANSVTQRTREFGIRLAIGAGIGDIRRLVFRDGMRPVIAGLAMGLVAALAVNRVLESQLVGVSANDPLTFGLAVIVLIVVALWACLIPGRRAARVDPAVTLRQD